MSLFGGSKSKTTTTTTQFVDTVNVNLQNTVGVTIVGDNNQLIDPGAFEFGKSALDAVITSQRDANDLIGGVVADAFFLVDSALGDAIGEISANSQRSISTLANQVDRTIAGLQGFALEQAETSSDQVSDLAKLAILAVAAAFALPQLFKAIA